MSRILLTLALVFGAAACDDGGGPTQSIDMRYSFEDGGAPCKTNTDCPSNLFVCAYKIADGCSAVGHCAPVSTPTCASITELCGCDGNPVPSGACFYAAGYAGGPTTGEPLGACADAGP